MLKENTDYKVIDNFFPKDYFNDMEELFMKVDGSKIPWYYIPQINAEHTDVKTDKLFYFEHLLYYRQPNSELWDFFQPLWEMLDMKSLIRLKANCYPQNENLIVHPAHADFPYEHKGAIIYINSCDGFTILEDGTKIDSVANRVLFFDPSKLHSSTNCTDQKARFNINCNYY
jgi:hypothetical protein